ncbi:UDP-glucose 4-epimerase GalE [Pseudomonas sp. LT1P18]|uniref:UDP-glucose 4-epimerase GalE n=1 Tax=Pseudomonas arabinosi TaxID=3398357 RepID=UPI0039EF6370
MKKKVLITGGAGFIGSHTYINLVSAGYTAVILDNLSNSNPCILDRLESITNTKPELIIGNINDAALLEETFSKHNFSAVIHFAGLKAVGESVEKPLDYYNNNISGTLCLLSAMQKAKVKTLIFSSSATVYGNAESSPLKENHPRSATSPYGRSKLIVENILEDLSFSDPTWNIACLRYFNPVGAHPSGLIGEDPKGTPNNLMPYIAQVAVGRRSSLSVFGGDYNTPDGTCRRDYIHVVDLAEGHVAALNYYNSNSGLITVNLGTGSGVSVLQVIEKFEEASGVKINYSITSRRSGDVAECWADPTLAKQRLGWVARRSIEDMCKDTWNWQSKNPTGLSDQQ